MVRKHNKPRPRVAHRGIARFLRIDPKLNQVAPSLKISWISVQPFSRNLTNTETKKDTYKQRNRSKTIPRPPIYRGPGKNYVMWNVQSILQLRLHTLAISHWLLKKVVPDVLHCSKLSNYTMQLWKVYFQ